MSDWQSLGFGDGEGKRRVALVIGNWDYDDISDLPNAEVDADNITRTLRSIGFDVVLRPNVSGEGFDEAQDAFLGALELDLDEDQKADVALFYYAGHGVQLNGENFAVAIDFMHPASPDDPRLFRIQLLMQKMSACAENCLIFLDACRDRGGLDPDLFDDDDEPITEFPGGFAKMDLDRDDLTFMAFAADPGDGAEDGIPGDGSPFSSAVAKHVPVRNIDLHKALQRVANDVRDATDGRQRPWAYSNMSDSFCLVPKSWRPTILLSVLGFVAGVINAWFAYDPMTAYPYDVQKCPLMLFSVVLFGGVLAYGVWRWGRGTWWAALIAFAVYAAAALLSRLLVGAYTGKNNSALEELHNADGRTEVLFVEPAVHQFLLILILASAFVGLASVVSGALTSRALRPIHRASMGIVIGILSAAIYVGFLAYPSCFVDGVAGDTERALSLKLVAIYLATGLWQALLAGNVGWAYTHYAGEPD